MPNSKLIEAELTGSVIGAFYEVYNTLGFGFLEHLYVMALERELLARGHRVARELGVRVEYKGEVLGFQRLDLVVDETLVVEIKSTYDLNKAAKRQLYNYLRATSFEIGLLLHFGPTAKFHRLVAQNAKQLSAESASSDASGRTFV
jgi:GxxExxY protein